MSKKSQDEVKLLLLRIAKQMEEARKAAGIPSKKKGADGTHRAKA